MIKKFLSSVLLVFYYSFFQYLPRNRSTFGFFAAKLRGITAAVCFEYAAEDCAIERRAYFGRGEQIRIGKNSSIGFRCELHGKVIIGNYVMMGPETIILTKNHVHTDINLPMYFQGETESELVEIGNDVWIGTRVIILPGVKIGNGTIIGAGSIVTSNIPDFVVAAGVPCKVIRHRKQASETDKLC